MPVSVEHVVISTAAVMGEPVCPACGSSKVVEARSTPTEVIFRCLHCWRLFTRTAQPVA